MRYLIGIDEAGRGPLAGPVSVGVVVVPTDFDWTLVAGATDSKMMTEKSRDRLFEILVSLKNENKLDFAVGFSSAKTIDDVGIVPAVQSAMNEALSQVVKVRPSQDFDFSTYEVLLDGGLKAPAHFSNQKTIIRGDQSEQVISLASIAAKVLRDRIMIDLASSYPAYAFEKHKGYGTAVHCKAIEKHGLSDVHRASFCTRFLK